MPDVGIVVIGRNEGVRLGACLRSVAQASNLIVYVDSGSTDSSVMNAKGLGVHVLELNMSKPFTAARARNAGFDRLTELYPDIVYVQFIDGDCELAAGWIEKAVSILDRNKEIGIVCGRRKERFPDNTIYNLLCDIEWDTPVGFAKACGGDFVVKTDAFKEIGGFNEFLIAGEEPELCIRLCLSNWKIWREDCVMTLHDAAMTGFIQWWKRTMRAGYAFAEGHGMYGRYPLYHWTKETFSAVFWGAFYPLVIITLVALTDQAIFLGLFLLYPLQVMRISLKGQMNFKTNLIWAFFIVLAKFPEITGVLKCYWHKIFGQQAKLIEYK